MTQEAPADDLHLAEASDLLLFEELFVGSGGLAGMVAGFEFDGSRHCGTSVRVRCAAVM
jgi:hypothetical protein